MEIQTPFPLHTVEPQLRSLLPADLYAAAWVDPSQDTFLKVFDHLRALQRVLADYLPPHVAEIVAEPGRERSYEILDSALMFTDLAGFTPLMEANAAHGRAGAQRLLTILNEYFSAMIEVISMSGGNLLEFTGDAMLAQFLPGQRQDNATAQAVRAGLRMQRVMARFCCVETPHGPIALNMRIGIHTGQYLTASIGTPMRKDFVLLGNTVRHTKQAEGAGEVGRICLTDAAFQRVGDKFRCAAGAPGHHLVMDDFTVTKLGEFEIAPAGYRRLPRIMLFDRSLDGLVTAIERAVTLVEPLASYLPRQVLTLVVENVSRREIRPDFAEPVVMFVNLIGLSESARPDLPPEENARLVNAYSRAFALINAAVESRGGTLKKVTYHLSGSDMMIIFGAPTAHTNDPERAAGAALAIRDIIRDLPPLTVGGEDITVTCKIGMTRGPCFAAEVGSPRGRREFNVLGDVVNTAARLMAAAEPGEILISDAVRQKIHRFFECEPRGQRALKGKAEPVRVFALRAEREA
jgi:class 3 adenylate cyclase